MSAMSTQPKKRKRLPLSCDNCRKKKAKCDRNLPCSNCIKLSISHTCIYSSPDHINHTKFTSILDNENPSVHKTSSSVHNELYVLKSRLNHLETSITSASVSPTLFNLSGAPNQADLFLESDNGLAKSNKDLLVHILPYDSEDETINFYFSEENGSRVSKQPLPFIFLMKRDPGAKFFWLIKKERKSKTNIKEIYSPTNRSGQLEEMQQMAKVRLGGRYLKAIEDGYSIQDVKASLSTYGKELGLSFHSTDISDLNLEQRISAIIPHSVASCKYLTSFFEYLYPFFPIVDEMSFRSDLTRILGGPADVYTNKPIMIHIDKRTDYAVLSSYLYIIRLTYLLWFTNDKNYKYGIPGDVSLSCSRERQVAMDNPVPLEAATLAQECIDQCNITRKPQLAVLQALIFSRVYEKFAPEIGEKFKGHETQLLDGVIMNLAIALNINRDPDYALEKQEDNMKNLKRKIWHTILFIDLIDTMIYGTTLTADRDHNYDVKIPYYEEGNENIVDIQLEKDVIKSIACFRPLILSMDRIAKRLFDVKQRVKVSIILDEIRDLEMLTVRILGRFKCFLKSDFSKCDSFVIQEMYYYLNIKAFLVSIYFYFHIHFHEKGNPDLEFFYHKKVFTTLFHELAELSNLQASINNRTFGRAVTLILSPVISRIDHLSCMIATSFCVRLTATLRKRMEVVDLQNAQFTSTELMQDLLQMSLTSARHSIARLSATSVRSFYSWKINKVHLFGINLIREASMYECSNSSITKCAKFSYTNQQFREIEKLLRRFTSIYCISNVVTSSNLEVQDKSNCCSSHEVTSTDSNVLDSYHILSPDSIDSLDPEVKDEDTVLSDLQIDNFWVQLIKVHSDNDESCKNEQNNVEVSSEIPKIGLHANDGNLIDITNYEISADNLLFELFDITNIT